MDNKDIELKFGYNKLIFFSLFVIFSLILFTSGNAVNISELPMGSPERYFWALVQSMSLTGAFVYLTSMLSSHFLVISSECIVNTYSARFLHNTRLEKKFKWCDIDRFEKIDTLFSSKQIHIMLKEHNLSKRDLSYKIKVGIYSKFSRDEIYDILNEKLNLYNKK